MTLTDLALDEYNEQTFKNVTLEKPIFTDKAFYDCAFEGCNLREAVWDDCQFYDCTFKQCDLSLNRVRNSKFSDCRFTDCQLVGINWGEAEWSRFDHNSPIHFVGCTLNFATFSGLKLKGMVLRDCIARELFFADSDLSGANFQGTDFSESRFSQTDLSKADFTGATNYAIDITQNKTKQAKFSLPEAIALLQGLDIVLT